MECLKKTPSNNQGTASTPAPTTSVAASTHPGDKTADATDLLGLVSKTLQEFLKKYCFYSRFCGKQATVFEDLGHKM